MGITQCYLPTTTGFTPAKLVVLNLATPDGCKMHQTTAVFFVNCLSGWFHTKTAHPAEDAVIHPSTNRARRRVTWLIRPATQAQRHAANRRKRREEALTATLYSLDAHLDHPRSRSTWLYCRPIYRSAKLGTNLRRGMCD